jgi:hypothetical protein
MSAFTTLVIFFTRTAAYKISSVRAQAYRVRMMTLSTGQSSDVGDEFYSYVTYIVHTYIHTYELVMHQDYVVDQGEQVLTPKAASSEECVLQKQIYFDEQYPILPLFIFGRWMTR